MRTAQKADPLRSGGAPLESYTVTTPDRITILFALYRQRWHDTAVLICPGFFQSRDTPIFRRLAEAFSTRLDSPTS